MTTNQPNELLRMNVMAIGMTHVLLGHGSTIARDIVVLRRQDRRRTWS
jgi:hypothetical protein